MASTTHILHEVIAEIKLSYQRRSIRYLAHKPPLSPRTPEFPNRKFGYKRRKLLTQPDTINSALGPNRAPSSPHFEIPFSRKNDSKQHAFHVGPHSAALPASEIPQRVTRSLQVCGPNMRRSLCRSIARETGTPPRHASLYTVTLRSYLKRRESLGWSLFTLECVSAVWERCVYIYGTGSLSSSSIRCNGARERMWPPRAGRAWIRLNERCLYMHGALGNLCRFLYERVYLFWRYEDLWIWLLYRCLGWYFIAFWILIDYDGDVDYVY